jgi:hypothetical protein
VILLDEFGLRRGMGMAVADDDARLGACVAWRSGGGGVVAEVRAIGAGRSVVS